MIPRPAAVAIFLLVVGGCPRDIPDTGPVPFNVDAELAAEPTAAAAAALFREAPVVAAAPHWAGVHAPTITYTAAGTLYAAWYAYDGPGELDGARIWTSRLEPGGDWSQPTLTVDSPVADGNPVLFQARDELWLFSAEVIGGWSTARVAWRASLDDGRTWSAPTHVSGPLGTNVRFPPIETDAGRVLLPAYDDLFQRSLIFKLGGAPRAAVLQAVLETGLTRGNIQPALAQRADGVILAVMRNSARGGLWVAASRDDGATWSQPWNSGLPNPGSPALLMRLASGNLLLVYNDHLTERTRLTAALSRDDGATWSFRRVLVDEPGAHSYPAATQDDAGLIHLVYSHDRATIRHITLNEAWLQAAAADP